MVNGLYLYRAYSVLKYCSAIHAQIHTVCLRAALSLSHTVSTAAQYLAQGHFGKQNGEAWDRICDLRVSGLPALPATQN